ncbi:MAG TPA: UbiX family flavin prenyltransferase [Burkholderiales bacterium]|nr:UbiX family flavin prenyltransferase [Burkholderiales bacterium]
MRRLIIGLSGASGAIYGIRTLEALKGVPDIETHLVLSPSAKRTIVEETDWKVSAVEALADVVHRHGDIGAALASGSFITAGMIVAPCSIKTLSEIANSHNDNLLARAADVCLKERRRLVLLLRETPLHLGHIELMAQASRYGAVLLPPVPAFYNHPQTLDDIVDHTVGKALDQFDIPHALFKRWKEAPAASNAVQRGAAKRSRA